MSDESSSTNRWWDLPAASLLMVTLITAATRLVATTWTLHLPIVQNLAFLGVVAGLALGQSRFSRRIVFYISLVYTLFFVPWQIGLTYDRSIEWTERLSSIAGRLATILTQLFRQEVVQDSLLFVVLMSFLFWVLSLHAGYTLTRYGNAWRAVLPAGLSMFVIHSFDPLIARRAWYLAVFIFFALVLVARMAYLQHHTRWQQSRTALPPHLGLDFIRFTLLAASVIVLLSWTAPALASTLPAAERAWQPVRAAWNDLRDRFDNAFASLHATVGVVSDYYGDNLLLGRGNKLTDTPAFSVKVPPSSPDGIRYYWRARTYDTYTNGQWASTGVQGVGFDPRRFEISFTDEKTRWIGTFEFTAFTPVSTLFAPAQPLWVSRPATADITLLPDGSADLSSFRASPGLARGEVYQAMASLSTVTIAQMRSAGEEYPAWVTDRYLQLPATVTERTRQLALQITQGLETPYDKADAITNWLRDNIEYSEIIPEKPEGVDSVDWFLFDEKRGFCNYYASAEVVMLRSLGIPARWSVGFAQGEKQEDGSYLVRQRDSHAWPEVYFPGLGWVEFEPTAAQDVLVRLPGDPALAGENAGESEAERLRRELEEERRLQREAGGLVDDSGVGAGQPEVQSPVLQYLVPVLVTLAALALAWRIGTHFGLPMFPIFLDSTLRRFGITPPAFIQEWARRAAARSRRQVDLVNLPIRLERTMVRAGLRPPDFLQRWARRAALPPLAKSYLEINNALGRVGRRAAQTDTPAERAETLSGIIPETRQPAAVLVSEYQLATFSPQPADVDAARLAGRQVRSLSYRAFFRQLLQRFQRPERRDVNLARRRRL